MELTLNDFNLSCLSHNKYLTTVFSRYVLENLHLGAGCVGFCRGLIRCTISKTRASVSSGYPNTEKQMKARGRRQSAFIVSRCLDTPMKHEARVLEIASHDQSQTNHKQRLPIRIVCYLTFLHG